MTTPLSRSAIPFNWGYADRLLDANAAASAITGGVIVWTYTVGANILARLEQSGIIVTGGAANATRAWIQVNRAGTQITVNEVISNGGVPYLTQNLAHDILLQAGDTVSLFYITAAIVVIAGSVLVREIDL